MAISPLRRILTGSSFEALPGLISGVRRGMSGRQLTDSLKKAGMNLSYRNQVLPAMKYLRTLEERGARVSRMRRTTVVPTNQLPYAASRLRRKYSYRVLVQGMMDGVGETERYIYVSTDRDDLTIADITDKANEIMEENFSEYGITVTNMHVQFGQQRYEE